MSVLAAIYWSGVLFSLGIGLSLSQSIAEESAVLSIALLILFGGLSLMSWVMAGILIGAILGSILNRTERIGK